MRLDKFLKVARIIKRRTVAKEACDGGRVSLNGRSAKAGAQVALGDRITISFGSRELEIEVVDLDSTVRANDASNLYRVIRDEAV